MPKKKVQPLFEEPVKTPAGVKKSTTPKVVSPKKKTTPGKSTNIKKEDPVKPIPKKKTSTEGTKKTPIESSAKKEKVNPKGKNETRKISSKAVIPPVKKAPAPRVKELKIEEPGEEQIEAQEEKKPSYIKESKRKPKIDKNAPPKKIKHKLKVGDKVIVTFLGQPRYGVIIELSPEGMYKVKTDKGLTLPRAKHEEGDITDKAYPSYIIKVL
jgi:hypothetical protein